MFLHFGEMNYGKVDRVPGLFYVATQFFHFNFVPLVPMRSYVIVAGSEKGEEFTGVRIPLSLKSVAIAWLRAGLVLLCLFVAYRGVVGLIRYLEGRQGATLDRVVNPLYLLVGFIIFFALTYRFTRAGYNRALELGTHLGMSEEEVEAHFGGDRAQVRAAKSLDTE